MTDRTDAPNTHTILVIDDDPDIRRLLRLAREEAGYDVREAREGDDGLAIAKQERCSLAIISPQYLNIHVGDEVRWQNLRNEPVRISLLNQLSGSGVSCRTGFSRFGSLDDTATIPPNAYVSLCFARTGSIQYNIWLKPEDPLRSMTSTAKIVISARAT